MCPNFGTTKINFHLEQMENLLFLGVPILKVFPLKLILAFKSSSNMEDDIYFHAWTVFPESVSFLL